MHVLHIHLETQKISSKNPLLLQCAFRSSLGRARIPHWHSTAWSKSFMGEGENPLAGFTPCQSRPCFKASWIQERGGGKKPHTSKNRVVKKNIHCCWAEWKIIWCNKWDVRNRPAHDSRWVCAYICAVYVCLGLSISACVTLGGAKKKKHRPINEAIVGRTLHNIGLITLLSQKSPKSIAVVNPEQENQCSCVSMRSLLKILKQPHMGSFEWTKSQLGAKHM